MAVAKMHGWSWRNEQATISRLTRAFVISILVHLLLFGGYYTGQRYGVWRNLHWPAWLEPVHKLAQALEKKPRPPAMPPQEAPLMFVEVNPEQATAEPPKDAKYYSSLNTKAANPEPEKAAEAPKVTGKQTQMVRAEDVPREKFTPLQPSRPSPPSKEAQPELKAKSTEAPGDLTLAKPDDHPKKDEGEAKESRPRTLKEALRRAAKSAGSSGRK